MGEEEEKKWIALAQAGDLSTQNYFIQFHRRLVKSIAKRYLFTGHSLEDLTGFGLPGLFHAIKKFNLEISVRFSTFATFKIRSAIIREIRSYSFHRGIGKKKVYTLSSLRVGRRNSKENEFEVEDSRAALAPSLAEQGERESKLRPLVEALPEREGEVLRLRFGFGDEGSLTQKEVSEVLGCTVTRVQQLERAGLDRLRKDVWLQKHDFFELVSLHLDVVDRLEQEYAIVSGNTLSVFDFRVTDYPSVVLERDAETRRVLIDEVLDSVSGPKQIDILVKYLGLRGHQPKTLDQIARENDVKDARGVLGVYTNARKRVREKLAERPHHYAPLLLPGLGNQ